MKYELNYNQQTGQVNVIIQLPSNANIPLCEANTDYQDFLKWNAEQETPLDLKSTITVTPPVIARDLLKELDSMKVDIVKLKAGKVDKI